MLHPRSDLKNTYQIVDFLAGAWPDAQAKQSSHNLVGHADSFKRGVLIFICHLEFARFRLDTVRRGERSLIGLPVLGPGLRGPIGRRASRKSNQSFLGCGGMTSGFGFPESLSRNLYLYTKIIKGPTMNDQKVSLSCPDNSGHVSGSDCIIVLHYECIIILRSTDKDYASASAIASP